MGVLTLIAGIVAGGDTANAAPDRPATVTSTRASASVTPDATRYVIGGAQSGAAATSAGNVWAIGHTGTERSPKILIPHSNGKA
jgi:hypothetical protein